MSFALETELGFTTAGKLWDFLGVTFGEYLLSYAYTSVTWKSDTESQIIVYIFSEGIEEN